MDSADERQTPTTYIESSPLTTPKQRSSKLVRRESSLAENIMAGLFQAFAFEYEVAQEQPDDEGSDVETESADGIQRTYTTRSTSRFWCHRAVICLSLIAGAFLTGRLTSSSLTTHDESIDPIFAMKATASLEGLLNGAVATDHEICSKLGTDVLKKGGNAVDAAVTTTLCLGVANPASSGLGGGAFILIHSSRTNHEDRYDPSTAPNFEDKSDPNFPTDATMMTEVIDCRETAPGASDKNMFSSLPTSASSVGGLAIAVPGELTGLELAHARHGLLPWSELIQPVIMLAKDGVPVSSHLARDIQSMVKKSKQFGEFQALRKLVTKHDDWNTALLEGELLRNEKLAETLSRVADDGSKALYEGELAKSLVIEVQSEGGILTTQDLSGYVPVLRSPVFGTSNDFTIVGVPPPSSGGVTVIGAARFLSGYQLPLASFADTLSVHRTVEAMRHAFAIRMSLSDPVFYTNKTAEAVQDLTSGDYMDELRKSTLDNSTLSISQYGGSKWAQLHDGQGNGDIEDQHEGDRRLRSLSAGRKLAREFGYLEDFGTTHLSIVDANGNAVAITSSVNQIFGSYVFSESTGILLGNTMDDFGNPGRSNFYGLKPSKENFIAPGKRPLSSMSPTMVFRKAEPGNDRMFGALQLVVGGSGGPKIITAVLQVIINYCFEGMPLFESVARARVHDQLMYHDAFVTTTELSHLDRDATIAVPQRTKDALLSRGHGNLLDIDYAGTVQAVALDLETNILSAVSDIRKGGTPAGY